MNKSKNPITNTYMHPASRVPAHGRIPAIGRVPAIGRKLIGFPNDGKLHVILDTNIIIDALKARLKETTATVEEKNCLAIIEAWERDAFSLGGHGILFDEYRRVSEHKVTTREISSSHFNGLIARIVEKAYSFRVRVVKQHIAKTFKDDHLFDGLSGDWLVSKDKGVTDSRVIATQTGYKKVMDPQGFILELKSLKLI